MNDRLDQLPQAVHEDLNQRGGCYIDFHVQLDDTLTCWRAFEVPVV